MSDNKSNLESKELKKAGLKITLPRIKILQILEQSSKRHASAEEVYQALIESGEDVGLATVYRVLTQFEQAGLIIKHHFESGHAVYELDSGEHHDHIVCEECGDVKEFIDEVIEERQEYIAKKHHFKITSHSLNLYGICINCQKKI